MCRQILLVLWLAGMFPLLTFAASPCRAPVAEVVSIEGPLELRREGEAQWRTAAVGAQVCPGDMVRVGRYGRAALRLPDETVLRINQDTTLQFPPAAAGAASLIELLRGTLHTITRTPGGLEIKTPFVNAAVRGTEFTVTVDDTRTRLTVIEGQVVARNAAGSVPVGKGQGIVAASGRAPTPVTVVRPRDAVTWALYYPPVVDTGAATGGPMGEARARMRQADPAGALHARDSVPAAARDAAYHVYRASLLLHTGQVDAANRELAAAAQLAPADPDVAALRSIILLIQGDRDGSLRLAQQATTRAPRSAAAWIAASYAWQARFDLRRALASAQRAVGAQPRDALARARTAELQLALGDVDAARISAGEAVRLNASLARAQTVLAFAELVDGEPARAQQRFRDAVALDQGDPLPRLGLGLARIRRGELAPGRAEIETAAALDPGASLTRSYLGKAYYEEKRDRLASAQYDLAERLDPRDPTPWFYDAILKQALNRPGEALRDLERSIARNDNRAVYSSRLALDQDAAARRAAQAQIYQDLGFEQRAGFEAWNSIQYDPANAAAHRFLAQSFTGRPRHELARASEALQSQLLQPLSLDPVPPSLTETDLNILQGAGPSTARLNEYNPLFVRNQSVLRAVGVVGSQGTRGDELTYAGIEDNTAWSIGQYHYRSDGFRPNNGLDENIYNIFVQSELSSRASVQAEARIRREHNGDLRLRFDPEDFSDSFDDQRDEDTIRLGARYRLRPGHQLIASLIYRDTAFDHGSDTTVSPVGPLGPIVLAEQDATDANTVAAEAQYLGRFRDQSVIVGGGYYRSDLRKDQVLRVSSGPLTLAENLNDSARIDHGANAHAYGYLNLAPGLGVTLGLSADSIELDALHRQQLNPKAGLQWRLGADTVLRAAAFRTMKRELVANQTIEPTQVSGFNQFFDDPTGTDSRRYGIGLDQRVAERGYAGIELSSRRLDVPAATAVGTACERQDERLHRAYAYWLVSRGWSIGADLYYERFDRSDPPLNQPAALTTWRAPVSVSYHHPNGLFAKLIPTYFDQKIDQPIGGRDRDRFWIVNAQVGYRLPRRLGLVSLEVHNAFDTEFKFYDADFQSGLQRPPIVQPERAVFVKVAISID